MIEYNIFPLKLTPMRQRRSNGGFTLIELVMIIVVVAIAIPVLLIMLGQGAKQGVNAELQITATNAGQAMLEEIKSKCWDESHIVAGSCTGTGAGGAIGIEGESRTICTGVSGTPFDDVDDYNGSTENCTWNGAGFTRNAQVCYVNSAALDTCVAGPTDYKRINVTVTNATLGPISLVTIMTNY